MSEPSQEAREEVVIVGGGLAGCLSALMLAKNPHYHVTLIEAQPQLLNGASVIASRLHLGGEYPNGPKTALHCLESAIAWKLVMPKTIYTDEPPMKFLIAKKTEARGNKGQKEGITLEAYASAYEKIRQRYEERLIEIKNKLNWSWKKTYDDLFGSFGENIFIHKMKQEEYKDYDPNLKKPQMAGGFQTQERGLNVPKYLTMIENELAAQEEQGNITILTNHRVVNNGIEGNLGHYAIHCTNQAGEAVTVTASQVVQAAWQHGPAITPLPDNKPVTVYKRAMLLVDLPEGCKPPPTFIMLGPDGGMLSPYNHRTAVCYLPTPAAAYRKKSMVLKGQASNLADDWDHLPEKEKATWTAAYFNGIKKRFPVLKDATNPRLIIRDTLTFQPALSDREKEPATEHMPTGSSVAAVSAAPTMGLSTSLQTRLEQNQHLAHVDESGQYQPPLEEEDRKGLFFVYPTKATYAVSSAIQLADMVEKRSQGPNKIFTAEKDIISGLLLPTEPVIKGPAYGKYTKESLEKKFEQLQSYLTHAPTLTEESRQEKLTLLGKYTSLATDQFKEKDFEKDFKDALDELDKVDRMAKLDRYSLAHMREPNEQEYIRFFRAHRDLDPAMLEVDDETVNRIRQGMHEEQPQGAGWASFIKHQKDMEFSRESGRY